MPQMRDRTEPRRIFQLTAHSDLNTVWTLGDLERRNFMLCFSF